MTVPPNREPLHRGVRNLLAHGTDGHPAEFSSVLPFEWRQAPAAGLALCFALGTLLVHWWQPPLHAACMTALLLAVAAAALRWAPRLGVPATAIAWVALGWTCTLLVPLRPVPQILHFADGSADTLTGHVVRLQSEDTISPKNSSGEEQSLYVDVSATEVREAGTSYPSAGGVRVHLYAPAGVPLPQLRCGDLVSLPVRMHTPEQYRDPGVWDRRAYLARSGIDLQASAPAASIALLQHGRAPLPCVLHSAQQSISARIQAFASSRYQQRLPSVLRVHSEDAAILSAMLAGDRTTLDQELRSEFERTGSFHLFVVSGMHVALLLGGLYLLFLRMGIPPWAAAVISFAIATTYAMLTGFGAPVQRALLMSAVFLLAKLVWRERSSLNAVGAAALAMLVFDPGAMMQAGFVLSVLAILAIAGIAVPLGKRTISPYLAATRSIDDLRADVRLQPHLAQMRLALRSIGHEMVPLFGARSAAAPARLCRWLLRWCELALITAIAEAVLALPMAMFFHRITPFALPVNLLVLPLVGMLLLAAATTLATLLVHPLMAVVPALATALLLHIVEAVVGHTSHLAASDVRLPSPTLWAAALALLLWVMCGFALRNLSPARALAACVLLPLGTAVALIPHKPQLYRDHLELTAIDVGQGDSVMIGSPQQQVMIVDAGGPSGFRASEHSSFDTGEQVVSPYLWSRNIRRVDVAVLTHAHSDHIDGMRALLHNFHPRELWVSVDAHSQAFTSLLQDALQQGIAVKHLHAGDHIAWSGTAVDVLGPSPTYLPKAQPRNDDSLVLRITYGRASLLEAGDAEQPLERFLEATPTAPVTLLKTGHHGSDTSTSTDFLAWAHPANAVISCGKGNHFGHPRQQVLQRLQAAGVRTSRTDTMGAVQYLMDRSGGIETHILASNP